MSVGLQSCQNKVAYSKTTLETTSSLPYYKDASFTPYWFNPNDEALNDFHRIPDFALVNQLGDSITKSTFHNKIYITDFFFTSCPGICPKMTKNMGIIQKAFKNDNDVLLLSHSATPIKDSVPVLEAYAKANHIDSKTWHLVTGDRSQIYNLGRAAYFIEEDLGITKTDDDFLHTENFVLVDTQGHIRGIYNGLNKTAVQQLIADIKLLKLEVNTLPSS